LLNENSMIGEDFRSQAYSNLLRARDLEQVIANLNANVKKQE